MGRCGCEVVELGWCAGLSRATGMLRNTVSKGLAELAARERDPQGVLPTRLREPGPDENGLRSPMRRWQPL
jgi:hypothetical protein